MQEENKETEEKNEENKVKVEENKKEGNKENKKEAKKEEKKPEKAEEKNKNFFDENTLKTLKEKNIPIKEFLNSLKMGFELAIKNGPLCEESMYGVIFILEFVEFRAKKPEKPKEEEKDKEKSDSEEKEDEIESKNKLNKLDKQEEDSKNNKQETKSTSNNKSQTGEYGPLIGQIIGSIKDCCRKAFICAEPRLYEAYYLCVFQINQDLVGKIYSVFSKRRGEIINEIPSEESIKSTIEAIIPVAESFGFVEEIRKKSSGLANNPMLQFYKWKMLNVDPFDIASEEDILNYGVNVDTKNIAKNYINQIRQRKGLLTNEKLVSNADKQRNLAKKK